MSIEIKALREQVKEHVADMTCNPPLRVSTLNYLALEILKAKHKREIEILESKIEQVVSR